MPRSILLVSYFYAPNAGAGAHRPTSMAKYLRRMGHRVTVLTTAAWGSLPDDSTEGIVRAYDLQLARARLAGRTRMEADFAAGIYSDRPHPLSYVIPPEPSVVAWAPFALARGARLQRHAPFDCVLTTSPIESVHVVGYALQRLGVPWVADIRDGWVFESLRPEWPLRLQRRLDEWLEATTLGAADAVVAVHRALVDDLRTRHGIQAVHISNGWDPDLLPAAEPYLDAMRRLLDPERVSLVHTGRLAAADRDPRPLLTALRELATEEPDSAARLELVIAGPTTEAELALLDADLAPARVLLAGSVSRPEAIALQRSADALLLLTAGTRTFEAPGKLFEYLAAGKPIVALAEGNEAARILAEVGAGIACSPRDVGAIKAALLELLTDGIEKGDPAAVERYTYPRLAEFMEAVVQQACSGAPGGR